MPRPVPVPDFLYGTAWKEDRTEARRPAPMLLDHPGFGEALRRWFLGF